MSDGYQRPEQLPRGLRKEVWVAPQRPAVDLALPKVDGQVAGRFRRERPTAPAPVDVVPVAGQPRPVPQPTPAIEPQPRAIFATPPQLPGAAPVTQVAITAPASAPQVVSIQINLPKIRLTSLKERAIAIGQLFGRLPRVYYRRLAYAVAAAAVLVLISGLGLTIKHSLADRAATNAAKAVAVKATKARANPSFKPLAPTDASTTTNGTPQVAYDGTRNTYSFTDTVQGQAIVVSQQPVPAQFKTAAEAVSTAAASLSAKTGVATNNGNAFIATDTKSNSQTIVFTKDDLLVFIRSPFAHSSEQWQSYINNLKTQ